MQKNENRKGIVIYEIEGNMLDIFYSQLILLAYGFL